MRKPILFTTLACFCVLAADRPPQFAISPDLRSALNGISADSLRGNLSFLASDLLEGRDTPSRGLDIAAEFIASQFRRAAIEPGGNDGYFQTAKMFLQAPNADGLVLTLADGANHWEIPAAQVEINAAHAIDLPATPVFKLDLSNSALVEGLTPEQLDGKVVVLELPRGGMRNGRAVMGKLRAAKPALVIRIERKAGNEPAHQTPQLFDPENQDSRRTPRLTVSGQEAAAFYEGLKPGLSNTASAALNVVQPRETPVELKNVVGILRGSDPALKNSCVMVSAHYDHIGVRPGGGSGDHIYNGADDDGSGTVSLIELANALAKLNPHPRRSILFVAFFGEEKGLYGSRYYAHHPVIPLKDTVADINLEQIGRTDSSDGPEIANASLTGFDYSDVAGYLKSAGTLTGIRIYKTEPNSDLYFGASDNASLADVGVPAHSLTVAFSYPDYHGLGDEWQKVDYANMAKVDRMIAVSLAMIADSREIPHWNADNPKAGKYLKTWNALHGRD